jgi:peptidoglycan pentaglycine glycine transferase (the first glycine)
MRHNETRPGHKRRRLQITGVTQTIKHLTRREWDELAPLFDDLSYCQGGSYAEEAAKDVGAHLEFVAILQAESVVGLANIRVKQVPFSGIGVAYALHAPLSRQRHALSEDFFGYCLDALRAEYVERRGVILRIVPPVNGGYRLDAQAAVLEQRGFRRSNRHKAHETFLLDLTDSLSNIRETFDRKWRNHLSKAQRSNVDVTISETLASFDHFEPLLLDLIRKKGFTPPARDVAFFRRVQAGAERYERMAVHLALHDGELVAGNVTGLTGNTAVYLLGASNSEGRKLRASYLLQWAVIEHAKSLGKCYYDLGGIDEHGNPNVYRFKRGIMGRYVLENGCYESAAGTLTKPFFYLLENSYNFSRSAYRKIAKR